MSIRNTDNTYGWLAKLLHWTLSLFIMTMLVFGFFLSKLSKDFQPIAYNYHKLTGLLILSLVIFRIIWTAINIKPKLPEGTLAWQRMAEHMVQGLMYVSMLMMPLLGWLGSCYAGHVPHLGGFYFHLLVFPDQSKAAFCFNLH